MIVKKFTVKDKAYEIQLTYDGYEFKVKAFSGKKPANGYSYNVTCSTADDLKVMAGQDAIKELIRIAMDDVVQKRYEGLVKAIKSSKI